MERQVHTRVSTERCRSKAEGLLHVAWAAAPVQILPTDCRSAGKTRWILAVRWVVLLSSSGSHLHSLVKRLSPFHSVRLFSEADKMNSHRKLLKTV